MANTTFLGSFGDNTNSSLMFRNKLINGNFDIWQRGLSQTTTGYGSADRWKVDAITNVTLSRAAASMPLGLYSLAITPSNATNSLTIAQTLEDSQVVPLIGNSATFSFIGSCASGTQTMQASIQKSVTANNSAAVWVTITSQSFSLSSSSQKFSLTGLVPNDGSALGLRVVFTTSNTANGVAINISQCQLEDGEVATPFEYRPIAQELSLCERYTQVPIISGNTTRVGFGTAYTTSAASILFPLTTTMRVTPTPSLSSASNWVLSDATAVTAITSITAAPVVSGPSRLCFNANTASGLTMYRFYYLETTSTSVTPLIASAEL